jgi:hypothetical protein
VLSADVVCVSVDADAVSAEVVCELESVLVLVSVFEEVVDDEPQPDRTLVNIAVVKSTLTIFFFITYYLPFYYSPMGDYFHN